MAAAATGGGGPTAGGCGGAPAGPSSWSRSLDRALEEAAVTGALSLSGRKLRDYPRGSAAGHDLSDTTRADLSRNRLSELPTETCLFVSLESLNLYQNCIRYIPEAILNLQSLSFLNISRNQLSTLPVHLCSLPLKVLIASNNKLVSLPEDIGQLRHLTENHLVHLPEACRIVSLCMNICMQLADLPLIRLDFSCNKIATIPVCYRNLRHLQTITLENNPLQSPPAQICIKGKIHIFKYLNIEACKIAPDLPDYDRRPMMGFGSCHEDLYSSRPYGALDSGFNSVDSGDKRWSGNEPTDEFSDLPLRVAEITKEQRLRRESQYQENRGSMVVTNGGVEHDLDQIDYIDSCAAEEEEEEVRQPKCMDSDSLSSQFMAYIEQRRISHEGSPVKPVPIREFQRLEDARRYMHQNRTPADSSYLLSLSNTHNQVSHADAELPRRREPLVERARREAQLAALQYEEERMRTKQIQREAVLDFVKVSWLHVFLISNRRHCRPGSLSGLNQEGCATTLPCASAFRPVKVSLAITIQPTKKTSLKNTVIHISPLYPGPAAPPSYRISSQRPESFLFRAAVRDEINKAATSSPALASTPANNSDDPRAKQNSKQSEEELELIEQLRKNIESRLKVSLPSDLGAALTDGVVLCNLANHVRPRSVPSIHVPSPAVPKLTMAKCRRNVENFLEACRKIGVPQERLCLPLHILEEKGLTQVAEAVQALLALAPAKQPPPPPQQQQQHHPLAAV
uniref:Leucine rich repeats and calponin homology domain containing 3 n=1 Tax=Sphenodon punctatus TaxID=8508 RepID=A0A8D0H741_SPHPU